MGQINLQPIGKTAVWVTVLVFLAILTVSSAFAYSEGFEGTGTPSQFTVDSGTPNFDQTTTVYAGSEAASYVDSKTTYTNTESGEYCVETYFRAAQTNQAAYIIFDDAHNRVVLTNTGKVRIRTNNAYIENANYQANTWYQAVMRVNPSNSTAHGYVNHVNGTRLISRQTSITQNGGGDYIQTFGGGTFYIDDFSVTDCTTPSTPVTNFTVGATAKMNGTVLNSFTVEIDGTNYSSATSTYTSNLISNSTTLHNITVHASGYVPKTYTNFNVSQNITAALSVRVYLDSSWLVSWFNGSLSDAWGTNDLTATNGSIILNSSSQCQDGTCYDTSGSEFAGAYFNTSGNLNYTSSTIAYCARPDTTNYPDEQFTFSYRADGNNYLTNNIDMNNATLHLKHRVNGTTVSWTTPTTNLVANTWNCYANVFHANNTCELWINGTKEITDTTCAGMDDFATLSPLFTIGNYAPNSDNSWQGLIDNVVIANQALTANTIARLAQGDNYYVNTLPTATNITLFDDNGNLETNLLNLSGEYGDALYFNVGSISDTEGDAINLTVTVSKGATTATSQSFTNVGASQATSTFTLSEYGVWSYTISVNDALGTNNYTGSINITNIAPTITQINAYKDGTTDSCVASSSCFVQFNVTEDACTVDSSAESITVYTPANSTALQDTILDLVSEGATNNNCVFKSGLFVPTTSGNYTVDTVFNDTYGMYASLSGSFTVGAAPVSNGSSSSSSGSSSGSSGTGFCGVNILRPADDISNSFCPLGGTQDFSFLLENPDASKATYGFEFTGDIVCDDPGQIEVGGKDSEVVQLTNCVCVTESQKQSGTEELTGSIKVIDLERGLCEATVDTKLGGNWFTALPLYSQIMIGLLIILAIIVLIAILG